MQQGRSCTLSAGGAHLGDKEEHRDLQGERNTQVLLAHADHAWRRKWQDLRWLPLQVRGLLIRQMRVARLHLATASQTRFWVQARLQSSTMAMQQRGTHRHWRQR